jgi:hypothetical protein
VSKKRLSRKTSRVWTKKKRPRWARHVWVYRVEVGTRKRGASLIKSIKATKPSRIETLTVGIVDFSVCRRRRTIDLVLVKIIDLGIRTQKSRFNKICRQARKLGLRLCPQETALQILWQWRTMPRLFVDKRSCWLNVASKNIGTGSGLDIFALFGEGTHFNIHKNGVCHRGDDYQFHYNSLWAFELPPKRSRRSKSNRRN